MNAGTQDVSPSLTATGTTQANALPLFNGIAYIGTAASGAGVQLCACNPGTSQIVYNAGVNSVKVYPASGAQINALGANNAMLLAPNTGCMFWNLTATQTMGLLSA